MTQTRLNIPARQLALAVNVRAQIGEDALASMKASILAKGVIQNLVAAPMVAGSTRYAVIAGSTRFLAVQALIAEGALPEGYEVPVLVREDMIAGDVESLALALSENIVRTSMDFVDECSAMLALAKGGKTESDIGALFGLRPRTVRERLLVARLIPESLELLRAGTRDLEWARALTMADATFQARVVQDIAANPTSWREGADIRAHLTRATVPAKHALFEVDTYAGPVVSDFFEGDSFADVQAFWALQNPAIDAKVADLEGEGYAVEVLRNEPFADWRYEDAPEGTKGLAIVEVMADGKVAVHTGKVAIQATETEETGGLHQSMDATATGVAPWEVRPTPRVLDYANAHKSALLQRELAHDVDAAMRYTVLSLLGVQGGAILAGPFALKAADKDRTGTMWQSVDGIAAQDAALRAYADAEIVAMVQAMDGEDLQRLFAQTVARRAGIRRTSLDGAPHSVANAVGVGIDVRRHWTPDAAFFQLLPTSDLRRLAVALVPGTTALQAADKPRKHLVKELDGAFLNALHLAYDPATNARLNAWVPGVMSFPAVLATGTEDGAGTNDLEEAETALFGAF